MTGPSRRTALRLGGAALLSGALPVSLSGCLGAVPVLGDGSAPDVEWVRTFDYSHFDDGQALVRTTDGGFAFVAEISTVETDETTESDEVRVIRTDADGAERWNRTYGDPGIEFASSIVGASDGEGFVVGGSRSPSAARDFWLLRIDGGGRVAWSRTYDGDGYDGLASVARAPDGGYALAGNADDEGWLLKVSASGATEWSRTYAPSGLPEYGSAGLSKVVSTDGRGYLLVGHASTGSESGFSWFRKTDAEGNVEWRLRRGDDGRIHRTRDAVQTADGGFLAVGSTAGMGGWPWESDPDWSLKLDADGKTEWRQTYGSAHPRRVVAEPDGGGVVAFRRGGALRLRRLTPGGETEWRAKYSKPEMYMPDALVRTEDGYAVLGRRRAGSIGDYGLTDAVLVKLRR